MSLYKRFEYGTKSVDLLVYVEGDAIYFRAVDIANFLGYPCVNRALQDHVYNSNQLTLCDSHLSLLGICRLPSWQKRPAFINEPGVYQLIAKSKIYDKESLQRWVTSIVVPSLRMNISLKLHSLQLHRKDVELEKKDTIINKLLWKLSRRDDALIEKDQAILRIADNIVKLLPQLIKSAADAASCPAYEDLIEMNNIVIE